MDYVYNFISTLKYYAPYPLQQTTQTTPLVDTSLCPISSAFSMEQLLKWDINNDLNIPYMKSATPLVPKKFANPTKLVGLFGQQTSGQPTQGTNIMNVFVNTFWQFLDIYVYWAGSASEGIVVPPPPYWVEAGHKNGVKVYGNVFFPSNNDGGTIQWVEQLVSGTTGADNLINIAKAYGFDGWFINQETSGGDTELATNTIKFLNYIRQHSDIEIMWYDAMDVNGNVSYQNKLDTKNAPFLLNKSKLGANSIFINYFWSKEMVEKSNKYAKTIMLDPTIVFTGINAYQTQMQTVHYMREVYNSNKPLTSVGLFLPNWTYKSTPNITYTEFITKDNEFWRSLTKYRSATIPDTTSFMSFMNRGQGYYYFIEGIKVSSNQWSDISQQDVLPTFRFSQNNRVSYEFDYEQAYNGGCSYVITDTQNTNMNYVASIYALSYQIKQNDVVKVYYKSERDTVLILNYGVTKEHYVLHSSDDWFEFKIITPMIGLLTGVSIMLNSPTPFVLGGVYIGKDQGKPAPPSVLIHKKLITDANCQYVLNLSGADYYYIYQNDKFITRASRQYWWFTVPVLSNNDDIYVVGVVNGQKSDKVKV